MTIYAIPETVPDDCDYLTAGKRYRVVSEIGACVFAIIDDDGDYILCNWRNSARLNGGNWTRIEGDDK